MPASVIGTSMPWDEAVRLGAILRADPASMLAASMEGWDHPVSREVLALYDLFDRLGQVNSTKPIPPHPGRPGQQEPQGKRMGDAGGRSPEEVRAILARARLGAPV